jgi:Zn-finger nucleic acid-binding protein
MPISVLCPSCDAPVNAPDSAAGKRAKCPKCQGIMILPGGAEEIEVVDEPAPRKKPRVQVDEEDGDERPRRRNRRDEDDEAEEESPKRKSSRRVVADADDEDDEAEEETPKRKSSRRVVADEDDADERPSRKSRRRDDDEEDEEDDDRPRKKGKGKPKKKAGPPMALLIGGGLAVLLLVAGGLYFAFSGGGGSGGGAKGGGGGAKGINWVPFDAPDGSFATAFPDGAPTVEDIESLSRQMGNKNAKPEEIEMAKGMMKAMGISMSGWSRNQGDRKYMVMVMGVPPARAQQLTPDALMKQGQQQSGDKIMNQSDFNAGGLTGKQFLVREEARGLWQLIRFAPAGGGKIIIQIVETKAELKADDADAKAFFDKFQWKK